MRVAVLGVGLIGGSVGLAAREQGSVVSGWDVDAGVLGAAAERGAVDRAADSAADALDGAEAAFLGPPVGVLPELSAEVLGVAAEDCVVTDVGSTKRARAGATEDERFIGGHPIAGSEASGVEHARADLFDGAAWYLTPGERSSGVLYERLHGLLVSFGARPIAIDAQTHDRLLATVSHLPHVLANVLVSQAAADLTRENEALPRVGPSFRDATRVAGASSSVWTDIYLTNAAAIAERIDDTVERLGRVAADLRAGDAAALRRWNEAARDDRQRLLEADLAGGPVHELSVSVPNRPGIVAQVALALGRGGVNIADMAPAPAPDNRTGAITLGVVGGGAGPRAAGLIGGAGAPRGWGACGGASASRRRAGAGRPRALRTKGAALDGMRCALRVRRAQVRSCVLLAGRLAPGETSVVEPLPSRDHTERMLRRARAPVTRDGAAIRVSPVDELELDRVVVPGDPSSGAFLAAAACVVPGSRIVIDGIGLNWTRVGFFRVVRRMGAVVVGELEDGPAADVVEEPVGDLDVTQAPLEGTTVEPDEVPLTIDELPLVALLGCFAEGETVVRGAAELRVKETDRIAAVVDGLSGLGAEIEATEDGFAVSGGGGLRGGVLDARGDHRMAMLGAGAGLASADGVEVDGIEAAAVSYPALA